MFVLVETNRVGRTLLIPSKLSKQVLLELRQAVLRTKSNIEVAYYSATCIGIYRIYAFTVTILLKIFVPSSVFLSRLEIAIF